MANVLVYCENTESTLRSSALSAIAFAREAAAAHGGEVVAVVIGASVAEAAKDAARYVSKVLAVDDERLASPMAETYAPIIARLAKEHGARVVCATATSLGKDVMPRVAGLLEAGMASDIASLEGPDTFKRAILAGNAFSTVQISSDVICVTARQSNFAAAEPAASLGQVQSVDPGDIDTLGAEVIRVESTRSERPDLNDADIVVSGGRGMGSGENFAVLEKLADLLGAAMGASRAATDAGMVPADWQVGQTGKIVAPKLYFAVAISGAIQHLAGMKSSKTIVAINKKGDEPIFEVADYGLVATWEEALPALIEEIEKLKASQT